MTYVSCYYHAFQGAQQVGNVEPQKTQYPYATYYNDDYNKRNVTKSFHQNTKQKTIYKTHIRHMSRAEFVEYDRLCASAPAARPIIKSINIRDLVKL